MPVVRSSVIHAFGYDAQERRLRITFTSGKAYIYLEVPPEVYDAFLAADSKGEFFNEEIRDQYSFVPPDGPFPQVRIIRDKGA
jgi:KTSC domain